MILVTNTNNIRISDDNVININISIIKLKFQLVNEISYIFYNSNSDTTKYS